MTASLPASVAIDQARELAALRRGLAEGARAYRAILELLDDACAACGPYLKPPQDDLVGAIKDLRQENALLRAALELATQDVARQRDLVRRQREAMARQSISVVIEEEDRELG